MSALFVVAAAQSAAAQEVLINTKTNGFQHQPAIAGIFSSEEFVAVWADGSPASIKGQKLAPDGSKRGEEFIVNTSVADNTDRVLPAISSISTGFAVAWIEKPFNAPGPRPHVHLMRFDVSGRPIGSQIQGSSADVDPAHRPSITNMIDGGFVVTWVGARPDQRIRAQRFGRDGSEIDAERLVNVTEGFHERPIAIRLINGNYVVAWRSDPAVIGGGALIRLYAA